METGNPAAPHLERASDPPSVNGAAWSYIAIAFGFAWLAWIAAIKMHSSEAWLNIGTAGPAIAAIVLSSSRTPSPLRSGMLRWAWFFALLVLCWMVLSLHYSWQGAASLELRLDPLFILPALLPAWILSAAFSRDSGVRALLRRLMHKPTRWSAYAFLSFPAFMLIPAGVVHLFGGSLVWPVPAKDAFATASLARTAMFLGYNILFVAVLEEPGWRGFLLDRLQLRFSPLLATMLVWLPWALWHAPLDYFRPVPFGLTTWILLRVVFMIPLAIVLSWFYNRSGRSIQTTALFHAGMNTFPFILPYSQPAFALLFVWAACAVIDGRMWRRTAPDPAHGG